MIQNFFRAAPPANANFSTVVAAPGGKLVRITGIYCQFSNTEATAEAVTVLLRAGDNANPTWLVVCRPSEIPANSNAVITMQPGLEASLTVSPINAEVAVTSPLPDVVSNQQVQIDIQLNGATGAISSVLITATTD